MGASMKKGGVGPRVGKRESFPYLSSPLHRVFPFAFFLKETDSTFTDLWTERCFVGRLFGHLLCVSADATDAPRRISRAGGRPESSSSAHHLVRTESKIFGKVRLFFFFRSVEVFHPTILSRCMY